MKHNRNPSTPFKHAYTNYNTYSNKRTTLDDHAVMRQSTRFDSQNAAIEGLEQHESMNIIHYVIQRIIDRLDDINPCMINEIKNDYDPAVPVTGPWLVPAYQATYTGQCMNDKAHGWGRLITKGGEVVDGFFKNGMISKYVRVIYKDGSMYQGGVVNRRKNGNGVYMDKTGITTYS